MRQPKTSYAHFLFLTVAVSAGTSLVLSVSMYSGMQLLSNLTSPFIVSNTETDDSIEESELRPTPESSDEADNHHDDCVLRLSSCAPSDVTCIESAVFVRASCADSRCLLPNNVCTAISGATSSAASSSARVAPSAAQQAQETVGDTNSDNGDQSITTGNDGRRDTTNGSDSISVRDDGSERANNDSAEQQAPLGCYDSTGTWTDDRTQCATDQRQFLPVSATRNPSVLINGLPTPPSPSPTTTTTAPTVSATRDEVTADQQDSTLQTRFREIFRNEEERKAAINDLMATASSALERLQTLQNSTLASDAAAVVTDTSAWVSELLRSLSSDALTLQQVQAKADELKSRLQGTAQIVAVSVPAIVRKPESLISKMDAILSGIPTVFSYMSEQGAAASSEAISEYQVAVGLYSTLRPKCLMNPDECLGMAGIIGHLETMRTNIADSLSAAGKTDLQNQIDAMMQ